MESAIQQGDTSVSVAKSHRFTTAVFCGAGLGSSPIFADAARSLARELHNQQWGLVYGGGTVGMMGEISKALVGLSGPQAVRGVTVEGLVSVERKRNPLETKAREEAFGSLTVVKDMHSRKALMAELADAFVALPGGFGTMEEVMEIITWNFIGIHDKPIVLLNVAGYYDEIFQWVKKAIRNGFVDAANADIVVEATTAVEAIEAIKNYKVAGSRYDVKWEKSSG